MNLIVGVGVLGGHIPGRVGIGYRGDAAQEAQGTVVCQRAAHETDGGNVRVDHVAGGDKQRSFLNGHLLQQRIPAGIVIALHHGNQS